MPAPAPICVIYNPNAGRGKAQQTWQTIESLLGNEAVFRPTDRAWHAADLAQQAADKGFATVAAAGGDGTVHEVINGLLRSQNAEVAFGVLPLGSGNDYARLIKTPFSAEGMVAKLRSSDVWSVDAGEVILDGRIRQFFCNTMGIGIGGAVTWEACQIRWLRGIPLYGLASLKAIFKHFHQAKASIDIGGETLQTNLIYAVAAIGKAEGGGFVIAPNAILDDGQFNLVYVTDISRIGAVTILPRLTIPWLRKGCKVIQEKLVSDITIRSNKPLPVHADGEVLATPQNGVTECVIRMLPGRLRLRGKPVA